MPAVTSARAGGGRQQMKADPSPSEFFTCPQGHKLPYRSSGGECTAIYCVEADKKASRALVKASPKEAAKAIREEASEVEATEARRLARAQARLKARAGLISVPDLQDPEAAEDWAVRKKHSLVPYAVAELEYQLKYGDDTQRANAAKEVLDRTGHGKQDKSNLGGAVIILTGGSIQLPWAQGATSAVKTVEGSAEVIPTTPSKDEE